MQKAWANLFVTITTQSDEDLDGNCVHILGEMNPWNCRVLDYAVRNRIVLSSNGGDGCIAIPVHEDDIVSSLASEQDRKAQTRISVENLLRLGCMIRSVPTPIDTGGAVYGTLREALAVSATGVNLYLASTGQELRPFASVRTEDEIIDMLEFREF